MKLILMLLAFVPAMLFAQVTKKCYILDDEETGKIVTVSFDYDSLKASVKGSFVITNQEGKQLSAFTFKGKVGNDKRIQPVFTTADQVLFDEYILTDDSWFMGDMFGFQVITFITRKKEGENTKSTVWVLMQCKDKKFTNSESPKMKMPKAMREKIEQ